MTRYSISQPVTQVEAPRLLMGKGSYTDDVTLPRECHAVFLRSPHAHAEIRGMDLKAAEAMPGVIRILTAEDIEKDGIPLKDWSVRRDFVRHGRPSPKTGSCMWARLSPL